MDEWDVRAAQRAVNIVAPVMAGQPPDEIDAELCRWLSRHGAVLPEPERTAVIEEVAAGRSMVTITRLQRPSVLEPPDDGPDRLLVAG